MNKLLLQIREWLEGFVVISAVWTQSLPSLQFNHILAEPAIATFPYISVFLVFISIGD